LLGVGVGFYLLIDPFLSLVGGGEQEQEQEQEQE